MSVQASTFEQRVLTILAQAHRRMDVLGYPPAPRSIDGRETQGCAYSDPQVAEVRLSA